MRRDQSRVGVCGGIEADTKYDREDGVFFMVYRNLCSFSLSILKDS